MIFNPPQIKTPMWFVARDTVVCSLIALAFIAVWMFGQFIGEFDGFIPFFSEGVFTVIGFLGLLAALGWGILPLSARVQIFPVFYK